MAGWRRQPALARAVNAMMRALGGAAVTLRLPAAATGGTQREIGATGSTYQEVQLAPVLVRGLARKDGRAQVELLVASNALDQLMPALGATDGFVFLRGVEQIVYGGCVFAVTNVSADRFAGVAYLYHVTAVSNQ